MTPRAVAVLLLAGLAGCAGGVGESAGARAESSIRESVVAANRELMDRFNRGDGPGVARMYDDDAVMLGPNGQRVRGREAIDRYWGRGDPSTRWTLDVLAVEGTAEMPIQRGRSVLESHRDGKASVADVQFIVVWRRQDDGTYRIAVDAWWPSKQPREQK